MKAIGWIAVIGLGIILYTQYKQHKENKIRTKK